MIRYRSGIDRRTGKALTGFAHVRQSVEVILTTHLTERWMLLEFGHPGMRWIGQNLTAPVILALYRDTRKVVRRWEPEYDITRFRLLAADATGLLALSTAGTYYPEGRYGNYAIAEAVSADFSLSGMAVAA